MSTIKSLPDLLEIYGISRYSELSKAVYDATECGATIALHTRQGGKISPDEEFDDTQVIGFQFHSIVEGSQAEFFAPYMPFPTTREDFDAGLARLEKQCDEEWNRVNLEGTYVVVQKVSEDEFALWSGDEGEQGALLHQLDLGDGSYATSEMVAVPQGITEVEGWFDFLEEFAKSLQPSGFQVRERTKPNPDEKETD